MKMRKCLLCGDKFEAYHGTMHTCDSCEDAQEWLDASTDIAQDSLKAHMDKPEDPIARDMANPALKARIAEGVRKRLEEP